MTDIDMMEALHALAAEKGISNETLMGALADALESAYKRLPGSYEYAWATMDPDTAEMRVTAQELDEDGEPFGPEIDVTPVDESLGTEKPETPPQTSTASCIVASCGSETVMLLRTLRLLMHVIV